MHTDHFVVEITASHIKALNTQFANRNMPEKSSCCATHQEPAQSQ